MAKNGKYDELTCRLDGLDLNEEWEVSFAEIEELIGTPLPASARTHQAWWANQAKGQAKSWFRAGCRTSALDLSKELVTFTRVSIDPNNDTRILDQMLGKLSIQEAKEGIARAYQVHPSQIEITIKW